MIQPGHIAIVVFALCYALFVALPRRRALVAVGGAALLVALGALSPAEALSSINWNVMGVFVGTLVLAELFAESGMPAYLAARLINLSGSAVVAVLTVCALTSLISAFVENVATVLIVAPVALSLARRLDLDPVPVLISLAVSSNLQGAATLIGDPPSMLLAGFARLSFWDFFMYRGRPGVFFAVQIGALASLAVLAWVFRAHHRPAARVNVEPIRSWTPTVLLIGMMAFLALSSFVDREFSYAAGAICTAAAGMGLIWDRVHNARRAVPRIKGLDWDTTVFLAGVFVLVGGLTATGWVDTLGTRIAAYASGNRALVFVCIVAGSVAVSALVDNVPYLAAMLPVVLSVGRTMETEPTLFLFGLLIGASVGGNVTPIGASANIVACGVLRREGYHVGFGRFIRIGLPFTIVAVTASSVFLWLVWS